MAGLRTINRWLTAGCLAATLLAGGMAGGCALYRNDHCYVTPDKYTLARNLFIETGSLDLVERRLHDLQWQRCEVNEAIYRLRKEFEVLPEESPAVSANR